MDHLKSNHLQILLTFQEQPLGGKNMKKHLILNRMNLNKEQHRFIAQVTDTQVSKMNGRPKNSRLCGCWAKVNKRFLRKPWLPGAGSLQDRTGFPSLSLAD